MNNFFSVSKNIEIFPLSGESLGTRGSCYLIKTPELLILIDPSISLGPQRYGLIPHPLELFIGNFTRNIISQLAPFVDVNITTHYHGDHYTIPWERELDFTTNQIYKKTYFETNTDTIKTWSVRHAEKHTTLSTKRLLIVKNPVDVSWNQKKRAKVLIQDKLPTDISLMYGDDTSFEYSNLLIEISPGIPHGFDTKRGNVFIIRLCDKETEKSIIFSSDVEGLGSLAARSWVLDRQTDAIILDGPAYYHPGSKKEEISFEIESIRQVQDTIKTIFLEHHFNRALDRDDFSKEHFGVIFPCASNIMNLKPIFLEAERKKLWECFPWTNPQKWFKKGQTSLILTDPIIKKECIIKLNDYLNYLNDIQSLLNIMR